jgi:hypothetical protein
MDDGGFWVVDVIAAAVSRLGVLDTLQTPFYPLFLTFSFSRDVEARGLLLNNEGKKRRA